MVTCTVSTASTPSGSLGIEGRVGLSLIENWVRLAHCVVMFLSSSVYVPPSILSRNISDPSMP